MEKIIGPRLTTAPNFRDVGGHRTADGRTVRAGLAFRSGALDRLTDADRDLLLSCEVRLVCDLRTETERAAQPNTLPDGIGYQVLDVQRGGRPGSDFGSLFADPTGAPALRSPESASAFMTDIYRDLVTAPPAREAYGELLRRLAEPGTVVHCTSGKDRTGWASAVLLMLLGVDRDQVMADYLVSNDRLREEFTLILGLARDHGMDPEIIRLLLEVRPEYLATSLAAMDDEFTDVYGYVVKGLGLSEQEVAGLRALYLG
ncbi:protein-tyrosine-phosphatase [Acrocarpospora corrugata]|uniref:Protein-tyrosine-phosphatase n=1 Tax=Acrocarpospora corrugata TaxID=35763 RepID=A0A5M3W244_9ACTN|nr:tyrosine-protein phosphatase [Acrocarpospora corrugata]GES02776.1 protein-tyrosine-phosphatase [Acrocarpospora corrugata]